MSRAISFLVLGLVALCAVIWLSGGMQHIANWALDMQTSVQASMASALRALHAGTPGALLGLWGLCFAYGFAHAIGPGHGKLVLGAYGAGANVTLARLSGIGMASALGQAATAIALVYLGAWLLGLTRAEVEGASRQWLDTASLWAILLVGGWLVFRGARSVLASQARANADPLAEVCHECGHRHAPDPAQVARAGTWPEAAALVAAIALRPCTGALFVLILTWRMNLVWQGIGAVLAMAVGTGLVTVAVAVMAGSARRSAIGFGALSRFVPVLELLAGGLIVLLALNMLNSA